MPQTLTIRDFSADDYPDVVQIYNAIYPDLPTTVEEYVDNNLKRDPKCKHRRWVAEMKGYVVGFGQYTQYTHKYDPRKFYLGGGVAESHRRQGIGTALYEAVISGFEPLAPAALRAHGRADRRESIHFLQLRGYTEYRREGDSCLDPREFDQSPYVNLLDHVHAHGVEIRTLRELQHDPDRDRKLYDLDWEVTRDEPGSADDTRVDFETFVKDGLNASWRLPDGYFVAVCGDEYVGVCLLNHVTADNSVMHGITGVKRGYRRKGIALAMKVRAITFAKENGYSFVRTDNEVGNRPMLEINERLGFARLPDWVFFEKIIQTFRDEEK